ncbi:MULTISPECIES: DNA topoisomerase IB [unclassified Sphingobium]|uniref:DNA topoisomerase IB n=1 Tax=unclassified Sphingobium TaxID=2611147 RepID=UPI0022257401|nr:MULTISPECIES: DNA topoisomerase IB [unclassified Sphingobium]MCW2412549.1 DNA topoisomerase-1 [Sphingobium sp. B8D3D]MCW2415154.1 DNA topoisomerase-1 [Sphingobium sp. B8D3A]
MIHALIFVDDSMPGIRRRPSGKRGWAYFDAEGARITERAEIDRLNRIGLPPAYTDAWFAPNAHAHILATGIDARGRKQYRYHPDFTAERDARKYEGCAAFGALLPLLRRRVEDDLAGRSLTAERAIASVVQLLDSGRIRVGNEAYAKSNRSFGATTLRRRHAKVTGSRLTLRFKAKSGKLSEVSMTDRRLIRFVRQMQDLPGQHLFQYLRDDGTASPVSSSDVNGYLRETMGADFTAKHFRTWRASVLAFDWLLHEQEVSTLTAMLTHVSEHLGNTPAIARKSYIHPNLIALAREGASEFRKQTRLPRQTKWLSRPERGLIAWLEEQQVEAG